MFRSRLVDVASRAELHSLMQELKEQGATILLATHDMAEAEKMTDRVSILLRGRIVATGSPRELTATYAMQAYLGYAYGQGTIFDPRVSVLVLVVSGILAFAMAIYLFNWDSQNRSQRGHPLLALLSWVPYVAGIFLA